MSFNVGYIFFVTKEREKESEINARQSTWNVTFFFIYVDLKMLMMMMTWVFSFEYFIVGQWLLMAIYWWPVGLVGGCWKG